MKPKQKKILLAIHKYLGIVTGLVVFLVAITGCCWSFKEEIENVYSDYKFVEPKNKELVKPSEVKLTAEKYFPNKTIHGVKYGKKNEVIEVVYYQPEPELFYQSLYINPYSGLSIKSVDHTQGFFAFALKGHTHLWLPKEIGGFIVSYSILFLLVIIITGIFIWWPKKTKNLGQRLKFKWNDKTRWKRKNFDLHTVVGFYLSTFVIIFAFTACIMTFNWFYYIAYKGAGGSKDPKFVMVKNKEVLQSKNTLRYNDLIPYLYKEYNKAHSFELHYPKNDTLSILVEVEHSKGLHYDMDYLFFDQNTIKELETNSIYGKYTNANFADKVIRMNYDIHIGSIGGIAGKIIAFLASLVCASLPVTGVLLWYGRKYKQRKA